MKIRIYQARTSSKRLVLALTQIGVLLAAAIMPLLLSGTASAAQLTGRNVAITDSRFSQTGVTYNFTFKLNTLTQDIEGIKIQACTTATGACTVATSPFSFTPVTDVNDSGWDGAADFADVAGSNDCTAAASVMCLSRTDATVENDTGDRTIQLVDVTNAGDAGSNNTENVFLRIRTYNNSSFTTNVTDDTGTVVTAMVNELSIQATVEETLTFCLYTGANCAAGGSSVDLGVQTTASTDTDVSTKIDIAANANNGISVGYYSIATLTSGTNTIDSSTSAGETDDPGADEMFGFCVREAGSGVVNPVAPYSTACTDNATSDDTYGFDATGAFDQIASSGATASDLSTLTLQFGTDIVITTESGVYNTTARFVAIPTY